MIRLGFFHARRGSSSPPSPTANKNQFGSVLAWEGEFLFFDGTVGWISTSSSSRLTLASLSPIAIENSQVFRMRMGLISQALGTGFFYDRLKSKAPNHNSPRNVAGIRKESSYVKWATIAPPQYAEDMSRPNFQIGRMIKRRPQEMESKLMGIR